MKILNVNKYYYLKGGAEKVYFDTAKLLEEHGHEVIPFSMKDKKNVHSIYEDYFIENVDFFNDKNKVVDKIRNIGHLFYSTDAKNMADKIVKATSPDLVHLHNIYHQMSPSFLSILKKKYKLPIVMTAHDYKLICPNYSLLSHGKICEKCFKHKYYNASLSFCHKGSFLSSSILALEQSFHKVFKFYERNIDLLICPSDFIKNKFQDWGLKIKMEVIPNFVDLERFKYSDDDGDYLLYYGRLSEEKGIKVLLEAMKNLDKNIKLKILGTGHLSENLLQWTRQNQLENQVEFLGFKENQELLDLIQGARIVILPSVGYENCPLTILEAFASGRAVIASNIGGMVELLEKNKNTERGLLFQVGNAKDLATKISEIYFDKNRLRKMGESGRKYVEKYHSADYYYEQIMGIYQKMKK
jgi:glycosyltransferase involved in cell wall biosynthesis